jgi:hypothetical protein
MIENLMVPQGVVKRWIASEIKFLLIKYVDE